MSEELIPCPFCGGQAEIKRDSGNEVWPQSWAAGCKPCNVLFSEYGSSSWAANKKEDQAAEAKAIERWNRRATTPSPSTCEHRIADIRNQAITGGYMCMDCGALFAAADHGKPSPSTASEVGELDERYEFERYMSQLGEAVNYMGDGIYASGFVQDRWDTWMARAALAAKPAAREVDVEEERKLAFEAFEVKLNEQKHILGMPELSGARPSFISGWLAARSTQVPAQTGSGEEGKDAS